LILSPAPETKFDNVPSDVTVSIKVSNFALGQTNNHWQVFMDDDNKLVADIPDASTSTTLKNVGQGVHLVKVALLTGNNVVAKASSRAQVGAEEDEEHAPQNAPDAPQKMPKTGADHLAELELAAWFALAGPTSVAAARVLGRRRL